MDEGRLPFRLRYLEQHVKRRERTQLEVRYEQALRTYEALRNPDEERSR